MARIEEGEIVLASVISDMRGVIEKGVMGEFKEGVSEAGEALMGDDKMGELAELLAELMGAET